jgi:hypothetical protein
MLTAHVPSAAELVVAGFIVMTGSVFWVVKFHLGRLAVVSPNSSWLVVKVLWL